MEFSTDLKALIRSHQADDHFDCAQRIAFDPDSKRFSASNAWWLAELSRWMYVGKRMPGHQRLRPRRMLESVNLTERGYFTALGIHASLVSASDDSFSTLVFRGTSQMRNWLTHVNLGPTKNNAHRGYENALDALWPALAPELEAAPGNLFFTGHSMGGALAALAARRRQPKAVYTFGAPPIGNRHLAEAFAANHSESPVYRLLNYRDIVSRAPLARYHVGELYYLRHDHHLQHAPDMAEVLADQCLGSRAVMRRLNRNKRLPLPERLCDHSPQNYVAGLERVALGLMPGRVQAATETDCADLALSRAQPQ